MLKPRVAAVTLRCSVQLSVLSPSLTSPIVKPNLLPLNIYTTQPRLPHSLVGASSSGHRFFSASRLDPVEQRRLDQSSDKRSKNKDEDDNESENDEFSDIIAQEKDKQVRTPWHREGSDKPPVARPREASAMTKGKREVVTRIFETRD